MNNGCVSVHLSMAKFPYSTNRYLDCYAGHELPSMSKLFKFEMSICSGLSAVISTVISSWRLWSRGSLWFRSFEFIDHSSEFGLCCLFRGKSSMGTWLCLASWMRLNRLLAYASSRDSRCGSVALECWTYGKPCKSAAGTSLGSKCWRGRANTLVSGNYAFLTIFLFAWSNPLKTWSFDLLVGLMILFLLNPGSHCTCGSCLSCGHSVSLRCERARCVVGDSFAFRWVAAQPSLALFEVAHAILAFEVGCRLTHDRSPNSLKLSWVRVTKISYADRLVRSSERATILSSRNFQHDECQLQFNWLLRLAHLPAHWSSFAQLFGKQ